mmetsp:Transcript_18965/g.50995  ORF Transcript_18965/g.50995 Transcript_18965/m.50995 type:complete len:312 (-) Transcript_18965:170-1105(-)
MSKIGVKMPKAFQANNQIPRSPRGSAPPPQRALPASPSTVEHVLAKKEARREAEIQSHKERLAAARKEHADVTKRLLNTDRARDIDTSLVLEWSVGANALGMSFAHRQSRITHDHTSRETGDPMADEPVPEPAMSLGELRQQWVEAACLLRSDMATEDSYEQARKCVRQSLQFLDKLSEVAEGNKDALPGGTGTIFQELLKDLSDCGVAGMMIDNLGAKGGEDGCPTFEEAASASAMASALSCPDLWPKLLAQANDVRCIVRIKLQDANDLKAAQYALECCSTCFQEISAHAKARGISNYAMAQVLNGDEE